MKGVQKLNIEKPLSTAAELRKVKKGLGVAWNGGPRKIILGVNSKIVLLAIQ